MGHSKTSSAAPQVIVARFAPLTTVLGPGRRAVVWVQGCPFRCNGCVAPETLPFAGGQPMAVAALAERILSLDSIEGVTFSGGEPFAQASPLTELIDLIHAVRPLSMMSYSGYALEWLRKRGTQSQRALLERLDILVDGPYRQDLHADLRWRGSTNQHIHLLTERYRMYRDAPDVNAGLEFEVTDAGALHWIGVPAQKEFRSRLETRLAEDGIRLEVAEVGHE